jgi:excisionase family DNA binding protein
LSVLLLKLAASRVTPRRPASVARAAEHYDVSERTIRRWITSGQLPAWRIGPRVLRVDLDDLEKLARPVPTAGDGIHQA